MARVIILSVLFVLLVAPWSSAAVVVIANRFNEDIRFFVAVDGQREKTFRVKPGELVPFTAPDQSRLSFRHAGVEHRYALDTDSAYFFVSNLRGGVQLRKIGLTTERPRVEFASKEGPVKARDWSEGERITIPVTIFVDENERRQRSIWEPQLRARVAKASEIIGHFAPVEFKVIGIGTWKSDDTIHNFLKSFREFETEVDAGDAQIAIGFTSQYEAVRKGGVHLGGTRGPLDSHVLVREWSKYIGEDEKLEVLVHELGHVLGAAHSPEPRSVMRPKLGDRRVNARDFRVGFDPLNTLAMYLIAQQMQNDRVTRVRDLPMPTKRRLADIYAELALALPKDPAALNYLKSLGARIVRVERAKPKR